MTRPAMFTQQRKTALAIAAEWRIPGMDPDDVRQEALIALWVATAKHDPERGPWPPFARLTVKARMRDLLQAATRMKRTATVLELDPERDADPVQLDLLAEQRSDLARYVTAPLSSLERQALSASVNGDRQDKRTTNAAERARRKLRAAA